METLEAIQKTIGSLEELHSVVKTMKALAAVNIRQYEQAAGSLSEFNRAVELGLQATLRLLPENPRLTSDTPRGRVGCIVVGSDQGMCGALNERIASYTLETLREHGVKQEDRTIIAVGLRVTTRLEDAGEFIEHSLPVPGSAEGVTSFVQNLTIATEEWRTRHGVGRILLLYNQFLSGASYQPHLVQLLPLDPQWVHTLRRKPWPSHVLPLVTMDPDRLFFRLIQQHLFVSFHRALCESLASENASRLTSMQNAERNISERLDELQGQFHQQRQTAITGELLDILSGFEALMEES